MKSFWTSVVFPSLQEGEEEEEAENEGEDWVHLQPSCINMDDKMDDKRNLHV